MKLLQTTDYLLLIDEEAEIKEGNLVVRVYEDDIIVSKSLPNSDNLKRLKDKRVFLLVAYYPLNKEAEELDLPELPNPFNKQIDEVTHLKNLGNECFIKMKELNPSGGIKEFIRMAVEFGYKAAQSKQ